MIRAGQRLAVRPSSERYVRLPLVPREAPAPWRATWRYRAVAVLLLAALTLGAVRLMQALTVASGQNPGMGGPVPTGSPVSGG